MSMFNKFNLITYVQSNIIFCFFKTSTAAPTAERPWASGQTSCCHATYAVIISIMSYLITLDRAGAATRSAVMSKDQPCVWRPGCPLLLRGSSVVLAQQLRAATEAFGSVSVLMSNTDLNPVCGPSEPWDFGGADGRGRDFWLIQWVWSHPVALWFTAGRFPAGMFSQCVCVCVCVSFSFARWLKRTQRGES